MITYMPYEVYPDQEKVCFRKGNFDIPASDLQDENDTDELFQKKNMVLCAICRHIITSPEEVFSVKGNCDHTFVNPAGNKFRIRCFADAPGSVNSGELTNEYTWFPGYQWNYALCGNCFFHLGWFYQSDGNSFYGFIVDSIIESISM